MAKKKVDPDIKAGIEEIVNGINAIIESDFPATVAELMFKMRNELVNAGFAKEEALQLVVAHGVQNLGKQ